MKQTLALCMVFLLLGVGIGINEAREKNSQLGFIQAREQTTPRCADWSRAIRVSQNIREGGTTETLFACDGYKFYLVSGWSIYHSDASTYDLNLIKEIVRGQKEKEKRTLN